MSHYQIRPCKEFTKDGRTFVEETTPEDAQFYGLYARQDDGTMLWVSDHPTREAAEQAHADALVAAPTEADLLTALCTAPPWAPGSPLRGEVSVVNKYGEA